ncbi:MAG TPA: hypothetical protein VG496_19445 [Myxococcales bacterium]|nr:hypothetical protein [Myxococcales bacterium]
MSYRILVEPAAAQRLRTFSSYLVQRLGRLLADLADLASIAPPASLSLARNADTDLARIDLEDATVWYRVDRRDETLTLVDVQTAAGDRPGTQAG